MELIEVEHLTTINQLKHKIMKKTILSTLLIISAAFIFAQGEIQGKIFDKELEEPLPFCNVYVESGGQMIGASTDIDGRFKIKPLNAGVYILNVSYVGKESYKMTGVIVSSNKATFLKDIYMKSANEFKTIEIVAERFEDSERLIKVEDPSAMTILSTQMMKNPLAKSPLAMIASMTPGVQQADEGQPVYFRGSRNGAVSYYVDGMKSIDGSLNVPSTSIQEITVYTGGVPAKYGDVTGGVVIVETKSYFSLFNQNQ
jgi:hypothetical protein